MGHIRLGRLPKTSVWNDVVAELVEGGSASSVGCETAKAAQRDFKQIPEDHGFIESLWLLVKLPAAARTDEYKENLVNLGFEFENKPTLPQLLSEATAILDEQIPPGERTDISEMAQLAAVETLNTVISSRLPSLFDSTGEDLHNVLQEFSSGDKAGLLLREFHSRYLERHLEYYLSRETPAHVGKDERFRNIEEHSDFSDDLALFCNQTTRILKEFAGGWYGKHLYQQEDGLTRDKLRNFAEYSWEKIADEFESRREGEDE